MAKVGRRVLNQFQGIIIVVFQEMSFHPNSGKRIEKLEYLHPEGVKYTSPGQRPGNIGTQYVLALKGRNIS